MASIKQSLVSQGIKLMGDPRVLKLMADPRVMNALMGAISVPGKLQSFTAEQVEKVAKAMALATEDEVSDLKRTVRKLEEEVARMRRDSEAKK